MKIFIDDAGSFSLYSKGTSLFCGVTIADSSLPTLLERFARWRRSIIGKSNRELKGAHLTENQLDAFVYKVLPASDRGTWLTVVGIDTNEISEAAVAKLRQQASTMFLLASKLMQEHQNARLQEMYRQMSGWANGRSAQNILWIIALEATIIRSIQHSIVRFMEPEDDAEFENIRVLIDESFVRREEHVMFWREWLRNGLMKSARSDGLSTPSAWKTRGHPFLRKYSPYPGLFNFNSLFMRATGFFRSHNFEGLQIADICANIIFRYHRGQRDLAPYNNLRQRIVNKGGTEITLIVVNEDSLHKDDLENHVRVFDFGDWKRRADEIVANRKPK